MSRSVVTSAALAIAFAIGAFASTANAATAQGHLNVQLIITDSCRSQTVAGAVDVRCTGGVPVRIDASSAMTVAAQQTAVAQGAAVTVITY